MKISEFAEHNRRRQAAAQGVSVDPLTNTTFDSSIQSHVHCLQDKDSVSCWRCGKELFAALTKELKRGSTQECGESFVVMPKPESRVGQDGGNPKVHYGG
jgi:hypothetical protein